MNLKLYILDKSEKLGIDNKDLDMIQFGNLLKQEVKEVELELEKVRVYKNFRNESRVYRIRLAQEISDVIQICIAGLVMLAKGGIDIKLQVYKHNFKLLKEREWKHSKSLEINIHEEINIKD